MLTLHQFFKKETQLIKVTTDLQALSQIFRKYLRKLFIVKSVDTWSLNFPNT